METASQEGRQHDIQTLRGDILSYLFEDPDSESRTRRSRSTFLTTDQSEKAKSRV